MPFPETPRVRYGRNPLIEVVCQLKFPTILRIDAEVPAAFQERVRGSFPEYRTNRPQLPTGVRLPPDVLQMVLGSGGPGAHEFLSADGKWRVALTRDFVALTTSDYSDWKQFRAQLEVPLSALLDVYKPPYFSRIGLRYRDQIDRKALGLEGSTWGDLLRHEVAGELALADVAADVVRTVRQVELKMPDDKGNIRLIHGVEADAAEQPYQIDADLYTERQVPTGEATDVLNTFNRTAGNLFRWFIQQRLHDAMDPRNPDQ